MSLTDPVADMLIRICNACRAGHKKVEIPASNFKEEIAKILLSEKYIADYKRLTDNRQGILKVYLKYTPEEESVIQGAKRVSKPGRRIYARKDQVPRVRNGLGTAILSTSRGVLSDKECRLKGLGGEVVCYIW